MTKYGADTQQLMALSGTLRSTADMLNMTAAHITRELGHAIWKGPAANSFKDTWSESARSIQSASVSLSAQARAVGIHAAEQASISAAPGGAGTGGTSGGKDNPWIPNWLEDKNSPFRKVWSTWSMIKAFPRIRARVFDLSVMANAFGTGVVNPFSSYARFLWDVAKPQNWRGEEALAAGLLSRAFNASSDAVSGNWHKLASLAEDSRAFKAFNVATKGLGVLGAGIDGVSAIDKFSEGNVAGGFASSAKALLGGASVFAPPPANAIAGVITAGWTLYDNVPAVKNVVAGAAGAVADGAKAVGGALSDAANAVGGTFSDGAKAVGDFFGI